MGSPELDRRVVFDNSGVPPVGDGNAWQMARSTGNLGVPATAGESPVGVHDYSKAATRRT